jgi:hypothetical protein
MCRARFALSANSFCVSEEVSSLASFSLLCIVGAEQKSEVRVRAANEAHAAAAKPTFSKKKKNHERRRQTFLLTFGRNASVDQL